MRQDTTYSSQTWQPGDEEYIRLNAIVVETVGRDVNISKRMVEALKAAPATQEPAVAPERAGGYQV